MSAPLFSRPCVRVVDVDRTDAEVCAVRNTPPRKGDRVLPCDGCLHPDSTGRRA